MSRVTVKSEMQMVCRTVAKLMCWKSWNSLSKICIWPKTVCKAPEEENPLQMGDQISISEENSSILQPSSLGLNFQILLQLLRISSTPLHSLEKAFWWQANCPSGAIGGNQMALKANQFSGGHSNWPPGQDLSASGHYLALSPLLWETIIIKNKRHQIIRLQMLRMFF